jgi:hypothetical protein
MFRSHHGAEEATTVPFLQIDPQRTPMFRILQQASPAGAWCEVGWVWTVGASRTHSTEHWYLYASVAAGGADRATYGWPGYDATGAVVGTTLRLDPATPPPGQDPGTFKAYLEREHGVTITYIKGTMNQS